MVFRDFSCISALGELRSATGLFETVLLTLFHARIAGQETGGLEGSAEGLVHEAQGAGDAVADGAGLAGDAAAGDGAVDVDLIGDSDGVQGLTNDQLQGLQTEIIVDLATVDGDDAAAAGDEVNSGDRGFPTARAVHIGALADIRCHKCSSSFVSGPRLRASARRACARRRGKPSGG